MNNLQPVGPQALATYTPQTEEVLRSDIIVPYVTLMQGLSDFVKERKAQMGDIVRSTSREILGNPDKPINAIFLHYPKAEWVLEQKPPKSDKFEYRKSIPRTAANEALPWRYFSDDTGMVDFGAEAVPANSTEWKRVKRLSVFALLTGDVDAEKVERAKLDEGGLPDPSKALTPVIFSFRVMSYDAGKEICTFFNQAKSMGVPIWKYAMPMTCVLDQNDKGSFYVWKPMRTQAKAVDKANLDTVQMWATIVNSGAKLTVDTGGDLDGSETVNAQAVKDTI